MKATQKTVSLIVCYFGDFPKWFYLYLESCGNNKRFNFVIFTDCKIPNNYPENVKFIKFSLHQFNELASRNLKLKIQVLEPYKLCDFKPAYGIIFSEYLKGIDFWGHTDIDLIFGNIQKFITNDILNTYDIITARKEYLVGHFTLYRNCKKINYMFKKSKHYKHIFLNNDLYCFDECNFLWWPLIKGFSIFNLPHEIESMTYVVKREIKKGMLKAYFNTHIIEQDKLNINWQLEDFNEELIWKNGKLYNIKSDDQYIYFHFHFLKKLPTFKVPEWEFIPSTIYISNQGFSLSNKIITVSQ